MSAQSSARAATHAPAETGAEGNLPEVVTGQGLDLIESAADIGGGDLLVKNIILIL